MPILLTDYIRVYLKGTRYANGQGSTTAIAIERAFDNFKKEFGEWPRGDQTRIMCNSFRGSWVADVLEITNDL